MLLKWPSKRCECTTISIGKCSISGSRWGDRHSQTATANGDWCSSNWVCCIASRRAARLYESDTTHSTEVCVFLASSHRLGKRVWHSDGQSGDGEGWKKVATRQEKGKSASGRGHVRWKCSCRIFPRPNGIHIQHGSKYCRSIHAMEAYPQTVVFFKWGQSTKFFRCLNTPGKAAPPLHFQSHSWL